MIKPSRGLKHTVDSDPQVTPGVGQKSITGSWRGCDALMSHRFTASLAGWKCKSKSTAWWKKRFGASRTAIANDSQCLHMQIIPFSWASTWNSLFPIISYVWKIIVMGAWMQMFTHLFCRGNKQKKWFSTVDSAQLFTGGDTLAFWLGLTCHLTAALYT